MTFTHVSYRIQSGACGGLRIALATCGSDKDSGSSLLLFLGSQDVCVD